MTATIRQRLLFLQQQSALEKEAVLNWWVHYVKDDLDGFYGEVDRWNKPLPMAPKGLVLYSRILWAFSAAREAGTPPVFREMADRAYRYLLKNFEDRQYGGMYWSLTANGLPLQDKKQVYGQAFSIYGLSEYARVTGLAEPAEKAAALFQLLEEYGRDPVRGGYLEAFTRDWIPVPDMRLSEKDANEKKTMNTHLHVLEAYTSLYRISPSAPLAAAIRSLFCVFRDHIIDPATYTMGLFFTEEWELRSSRISFGHDIEASWLLCEAADCLGDPEWQNYFNKQASLMAERAMWGMDADGGLMDELDVVTGFVNREKHWWQQAESMVGLLNAYQLTGEEHYLSLAEKNWNFIRNSIIDHENGEWLWGRNEDGQVMEKGKAGFWKCPYHNVRACLEISRRCAELLGNADGQMKPG